MITREFDQMLPDGVQMVYSSLHIQYLQQEDFDRAISKLEEAAGHMLEGEAQCIIAGGSPVVTLQGTDVDIVERIRRVSKVPTTTTLGASLAALRRLGAGDIVVATPYDQERNDLLVRYLEGQGLRVVACKGLNLRRAMDIARLPFHSSYNLAREAAAMARTADAIYIPCARFPVVGNIDVIERDTGYPVVTSVQAMTWWGLETLGIKAPIMGYGRLLQNTS